MKAEKETIPYTIRVEFIRTAIRYVYTILNTFSNRLKIRVLYTYMYY